MKKIASFEVDHINLKEGLYISRIDDDIITYDIRMIKPNTPPFLETAVIHTVEHLFATFARNEYPKSIVYFGPMGCRTGFYLLTKSLNHAPVIKLVQNSFKFISKFKGEIPGASEEECGNYIEHNLEKSKKIAENMCKILSIWDESRLRYG